MHDRRGVEDLAAGRHRQADHEHRRRVRGFLREALELWRWPIEKAWPLHEIFGRVAADGLFGKRADVTFASAISFATATRRETLDFTAPTVGLTLATASLASRISTSLTQVHGRCRVQVPLHLRSRAPLHPSPVHLDPQPGVIRRATSRQTACERGSSVASGRTAARRAARCAPSRRGPNRSPA